jgi:hypothetical protein
MGFKVKEKEILYDAKGKKSHVLLSYKRYEKLIEEIEDAQDLLAIKEVEHEKDIPWGEAKKILATKQK